MYDDTNLVNGTILADDIATYRINLEIQTTAPLHISAAEPGRYVLERGRVVAGDVEVGIPCTRTRRQSVPRVLRAGTDDDGASTRPAFTEAPVIPASTIRGRLRAAASRRIEDAALVQNQRMTPRCFNTLRKGAATTELKTDQQTIIMAVEGARHPFYGLFGGTCFGINSRLVVGDGKAFTLETAPLLDWAPRALTHCPSAWQALEPRVVVRKDGLFELGDADHLSRLIGTDAVTAYHAQRMAHQTETRRRKETEPTERGKKEDLRSISAIETVATGTGFLLSIELRSMNQAQFGLLLLALLDVVNDRQFGGVRARGFGRYAVKAATVVGGDIPAPGQTLFAPQTEDQPLQYAAVPTLYKALASAEEWLGEVSLTELEAYADDSAPELIARMRAKREDRPNA